MIQAQNGRIEHAFQAFSREDAEACAAALRSREPSITAHVRMHDLEEGVRWYVVVSARTTCADLMARIAALPQPTSEVI